MLHQDRRIIAQTPSHQSINTKVNRLFASIYPIEEISIASKDALYENSLRQLLPQQETHSYLLVVDGSHVHETQQFAAHVQNKFATYTNTVLTPPTNTRFRINHIIFANATLGNYGYTVVQKKQRLIAGTDNLIWIYQEEPEQPNYSLNLPCMLCGEECTSKQITLQCNSACCQSRKHQSCYQHHKAKRKANASSASKIAWKCTDCELDEKTHPRQRFRGTPVKDWFLYQLVRNCNDTGFILKGVTHSLPYSSFFSHNKTGTLQERHLYKICRGLQLCVKLLKRLDSQIFSQ
jgi:hypothetical protein